MSTRSFAAGISLKTQELYALVFVCRYLDLFYSYISLYAPLLHAITFVHLVDK